MSDSPVPQSRAVTVAAAPVVLLAALVSHPHIPGRLPNDEAIAAAVLADPVRWGLVHLAAAVASAVLILAFLAVHDFLRDFGEARWSGRGVPLVVLGGVLYAVLPGMEFAPLAAVGAGGDVAATQAALGPWFVPVLMVAAVTFALGVGAFAVGIVQSEVLTPFVRWFVVGAFVVMAGSRFVPLTVVQFEVHGAAALAAFWPLARVMWRWERAPGFEGAAAAAPAPSGHSRTPTTLQGRTP